MTQVAERQNLVRCGRIKQICPWLSSRIKFKNGAKRNMTLHQGNQTITKRVKINAALEAQGPWHVVGYWRVFDLIQQPHAALTKRDGNAGSFFIHHQFHRLNIRTRQ